MSDPDNKRPKMAASRWSDLVIRLSSGLLFAGSEFFVVAGGASWVNLQLLLLSWGGFYELIQVAAPTVDVHLDRCRSTR
jgi:hypothetical protein